MSIKDNEKLLNFIKNLKLNPSTVISEFSKEMDDVSCEQGIQAAYNLLLQTEVILNIRKPSLAIYDHAFHFIGGAQKYGLTLISVLQDQFDITIIANKEVDHKSFYTWYNLDLSKCKIKIIKIPYFEERNTPHFDPALIKTVIPRMTPPSLLGAYGKNRIALGMELRGKEYGKLIMGALIVGMVLFGIIALLMFF